MKLNLQAAIDGKNDHELNLALCEWLGWTRIRMASTPNERFLVGVPKGLIANEERIPNHITAPESLGLVHEVEKTLQRLDDATTQLRPTWSKYVATLYKMCDSNKGSLTHATARQRVIAILLTTKPEIFEP